jgi:hypothetical protein
MTEIRLDRKYYHLHTQIGQWCEEHFGPVDFFTPGNNQQRWYRTMAFGYQDYHFAEEADASFFTLYWIWRKQ